MKKTILSLIILSFLLFFSQGYTASPKVYSVSELYKILNEKPEKLKDCEIKLKAYIIESNRVNTLNPAITKKLNYDILIDYNQGFINTYNKASYQDRIKMIKNIPSILTVEPKITEYNKGQFGTFIGSFYNKDADFTNGYKRFAIIKDDIKIINGVSIKNLPNTSIYKYTLNIQISTASEFIRFLKTDIKKDISGCNIDSYKGKLSIDWKKVKESIKIETTDGKKYFTLQYKFSQSNQCYLKANSDGTIEDTVSAGK